MGFEFTYMYLDQEYTVNTTTLKLGYTQDSVFLLVLCMHSHKHKSCEITTSSCHILDYVLNIISHLLLTTMSLTQNTSLSSFKYPPAYRLAWDMYLE